MKKISKITLITILLLVPLLVTGCNKKNEKMKVNKELSEKILKIKVNKKQEFKNLDIIEDNTLETILGINKNFVKSYAIGINKYNNEKIFAIIKPTKGQEETIKTAMNLYINAGKEQYKDLKVEKDQIDYKKLYKNSLYEEYKGYQIYIISENNEKNLKAIKKLINN